MEREQRQSYVRHSFPPGRVHKTLPPEGSFAMNQEHILHFYKVAENLGWVSPCLILRLTFDVSQVGLLLFQTLVKSTKKRAGAISVAQISSPFPFFFFQTSQLRFSSGIYLRI